MVSNLPAYGWRVRLHLITNSLTVVRKALAGGVDVVQVRVDDDVSDREAYELTTHVVAICQGSKAICLVNDRLHIALAAGADGGHVGADDLPVEAARRILGPDAVLGATARDPQTARRAVAEGATYLGVGPAYRTTTKTGLPDPIGPAGVKAVADAVDVPVVAIGGVTAERVPELRAAGAYGVAVVSAINAAADPLAAAVEFAERLAT
jgi:thiamine-phosphate pyrophosphorylase